MRTEAATGVMHLQAEECQACWQRPEAGKRPERTLWYRFQRVTALSTSGFQISGLQN